MSSKNPGMKLTIPTRPAPSLPGNHMNLFSSSENTPSDPFSPLKIQQDRKKPPPRPPPPKNIPTQVSSHRRSVFGSSKKKQQKPAATAIVKPLPPASNIPVGTLIDLQSPPSSPQFPSKLRSSLSVGNISNYTNSASLIESGFEDDFNSLLSSTATTPAFDPWSTNSDFTPSSSKTPSPDLGFPQSSVKNEMKIKSYKQLTKSQTVSKPTIICVPSSTTSNNKLKPVRPPPPSNTSLCNLQNVNTTEFFNKEGSPPMPCIPPPPPPVEALSILTNCPPVPPRPTEDKVSIAEKEPYCVAEYDYESTHPDDLNFKTGDNIFLISEINEEWFQGRLSNKQGIFPKSYVKIVVPLPDPIVMTVITVYPFTAETWDDLDLKEGDKVKVLSRINKNWLYGECEGKRGQFPECYTQDITDLDVDGL